MMNLRILAMSLGLFLILSIKSSSGDARGEEIFKAFTDMCEYWDEWPGVRDADNCKPSAYFEACVGQNKDESNVKTCATNTLTQFKKKVIKYAPSENHRTSSVQAYVYNHFLIGWDKNTLPLLDEIRAAIIPDVQGNI